MDDVRFYIDILLDLTELADQDNQEEFYFSEKDSVGVRNYLEWTKC